MGRTPKTREPARTGGGLRLQAPPVVSEKKEIDITKKWTSTYDRVEEKMEGLGFEEPSQPNHSPDAITAKMLIDSTPEKFAELLTQRLAWYTYTTPLMAEVEARLLGYHNAIEEITVTVRAGLKSMRADKETPFKMTDKEIKEHVEEDLRIRNLKFEMQEWQQLKIRIEAQLKIISKNMQVISRMQNERNNELSGEKRDHNIRNSERHRRFRR